MDDSYWLLISADRPEPCQPVLGSLPVTRGAWRLAPPADAGGGGVGGWLFAFAFFHGVLRRIESGYRAVCVGHSDGPWPST